MVKNESYYKNILIHGFENTDNVDDILQHRTVINSSFEGSVKILFNDSTSSIKDLSKTYSHESSAIVNNSELLEDRKKNYRISVQWRFFPYTGGKMNNSIAKLSERLDSADKIYDTIEKFFYFFGIYIEKWRNTKNFSHYTACTI